MLPEKIIDFHVHLFPDRLFDAIWKHFSEVYQWDVLHRLYYRECIAYLKMHGVSRIVYSNYAHKAGVAETLNHWNLQILEENEDLFCFAAFHPDDPKGLAMAENVLSHPRVVGIKLQLLVQRFFPDDSRLYPLYEMIMEKNKRILFHVGTGPAGNRYVGVDNFKKLLRRYPDLPANVAHMGGFEYRAFFDLLTAHKNLYFDTSFSFLPRAGLLFDLGNECLEQNKDRIVYGSDFPNVVFPREDEIHYLLSSNLSDAFYRKVFFENGNKLLALNHV
jgi:uncharacterized protein